METIPLRSPASLPPAPPWLTLRDQAERTRGGEAVQPHSGPEDEYRPERPIRCRRCRHRITMTTAAIAVNGGHHHTFPNPAGLVFEIGCFSSAPGSLSHGEATADFSWFAGYCWRYALCGHCLTHLGWRFEALDGHLFFGLVLKCLFEAS